MPNHTVGTRQEWLAARLDLLKAEKELTRRNDELTQQRLLGLVTWLILITLLRRESRLTQVQVGVVVAFATARWVSARAALLPLAVLLVPVVLP